MNRRLRTFTLWTGTLLSLMIVAAFVVSARWQVSFQVPTSRGPALYLMAGSAMFVTDDLFAGPVSTTPHSFGLSRWNSWVAQRVDFWVSGRPTFPDIPPVEVSPIHDYVHRLGMPLYALFLAVAVPTLLVWRFGRKPVKPGHCGCGYDLTGNTSGTCPECGKDAEKVVSTAVRTGSKQP